MPHRGMTTDTFFFFSSGDANTRTASRFHTLGRRSPAVVKKRKTLDTNFASRSTVTVAILAVLLPLINREGVCFMMRSALRWFLHVFAPGPKAPIIRGCRPRLTALEDRIVPANVWTVMNNADDGAGSLRSIIANNAQAGDLIVFGIQNQTITLQSDIPISINLTIDGGNNNIRIDGNNNSRIFTITGNGLSETINNLTFQNGLSTNADGGAISDQGTLTLTFDKFLSNQAQGFGGAISNTASGGSGSDSVTVNSCVFQSNTALISGGAISSNTTVSVAGTTTRFIDNSAGTSGGALFVDAGGGPQGLGVTGSTFTRNKATDTRLFGQGGAICSFVRTDLAGDTFDMNTAGTEGGAVYYRANDPTFSDLVLTSDRFVNNTGTSGGAVYSQVDSSTGTVNVTVQGSYFFNNQASDPGGATGNGGAFFAQHSAAASGTIALLIQNSTFYQNTATNQGGAIGLELTTLETGTNTGTLTSLTVYRNAAMGAGGGVWVWVNADAQSPPKVGNCIIAGNASMLLVTGNDYDGPVDTQGYNFIGSAEGGGPWSALKDRTGTWNAPLDPGLDPNGPALNGGPTETIKVLATSAVYRKGDPSLAGTTDQRGYTRLAVDTIGAYDPDAVGGSPG
jgi:predicted outer membrane repeat protein